ncbi:MAG: hypothetical protein WA441_11795 [Methyloceanibacter sp.]|jgi:hypothetical protein
MPRKAVSTILAALVCTVMTAFASLAASEFEGVWSVKDTGGKPFEITLTADGKANATHPKRMVGTWTEEGSSAVIKWDSGWTTKITKEGDHYVKTSFKKGEPVDGKPANTSDAQKK